MKGHSGVPRVARWIAFSSYTEIPVWPESMP
jgi:hypothetical protein